MYSGDELQAAVKRHLEFVNTHPYLAASLLGASVRLEEEIAAGTRSPEDVRTFKRVMMGPMAAIGDSFFWSSLRPFAAIWAIMGVFSGLWWAPLGFLVLFNGCHLGIRVYGISAGYRYGHGVCDRINRLALVRLAKQTHYLAAVFVGATAAILADRRPIIGGLDRQPRAFSDFRSHFDFRTWSKAGVPDGGPFVRSCIHDVHACDRVKHFFHWPE